MVDQFKMSSGVLLERLKDLEAQQSGFGERPQTANVLNKISKPHSINSVEAKDLQKRRKPSPDEPTPLPSEVGVSLMG